jgi:uncharacterized tellurite resistance protein B-like protein
MEPAQKLLKDYTDQEKGAYLSAIAAIATADRTAAEEELAALNELSGAADLSPETAEKVRTAATEVSDEQLKESLDVLKGSELRFSLLADLVAFAESDKDYSEDEQQLVSKIAQYLNIDQEQYKTIKQFVNKASSSEITQEQLQQPQNLLESLGLGGQLNRAGISSKSLLSGFLGMVGPMILSRMMSGGRGGRGPGGLGGMLGGALGGSMGSGGLGSLISMLNGGRGMGSTGGLLGNLLRGL